MDMGFQLHGNGPLLSDSLSNNGPLQLLGIVSQYFLYSYAGGKLEHICIEFVFHNVAYRRCDMPWFVEWMDFMYGIAQMSQLPCSPDAAPWDYFLLPKLKVLKDKWVDDVKTIEHIEAKQLLMIPWIESESWL
jgi:hypothetical protein